MNPETKAATLRVLSVLRVEADRIRDTQHRDEYFYLKKTVKTMKKILLLISVCFALVLNAGAQCCPEPPPGYDCFPESPAMLSGAGSIQFSWYSGQTDMYVGLTHVTQYLALYHPEVIGYQYEVQYADDLFAPVWFAYARWTATKTDTVTTFVPIYPCRPYRFYRVVTQAQLPAPAKRFQQARPARNTQTR